MCCDATSMQITKEKLEELKKIKTASFAVWHSDEESRDDIEKKIIENLEKLKSKVILLGINQSYKIEGNFINFHDGGDAAIFLRDTTSKCKALEGAYMTDISQEINGKADKVEVCDEDIKIFKKQLEILGEKEYFIVCFGDKTFETFNNLLENQNPKVEKNIKTNSGTLGGYTLHCYKVLHYSAVTAHHKDPARFISELETANELISKHLAINPQ